MPLPLLAAGGFLPLLGRNWKLIVILIALGVAFTYYHWSQNKIESQQNLIETYRLQESTFKQLAKRQTEEIDKWHEIGKQQEQKIKSLSSEVSEIRRKTNVRVAQILNNENTPKTCEASIQYLIDSVVELNWKK